MNADEEKRENNCCSEHAADGRCCGEHDGEECCKAPDSECGCGCKRDEPEEFDYEAHDVPLPKPTLITIVTTIAQQAMVSMGILPNPATGKSVFLLNQATYLIDSVEVIAEKVKGNATEEETKMIENVLSELRMLYVSALNEKNRRAQEGK